MGLLCSRIDALILPNFLSPRLACECGIHHALRREREGGRWCTIEEHFLRFSRMRRPSVACSLLSPLLLIVEEGGGRPESGKASERTNERAFFSLSCRRDSSPAQSLGKGGERQRRGVAIRLVNCGSIFCERCFLFSPTPQLVVLKADYQDWE